MNLENYYACFDSIVPSRICDYIIEDAERQNEQTAIVGDYNEVPTDEKDIAKLYKTRNSSIVWMNDPWIYREIIPFVREANQFCNWNFDFHISESCQFTKYSKSQHYTWHQDSWNKPKFQTTKEYLVPLVTGVTLCQTNDGNTTIVPLFLAISGL